MEHGITVGKIAVARLFRLDNLLIGRGSILLPIYNSLYEDKNFSGGGYEDIMFEM